MTLAERIREVRRWSGLTQTQFAERIGLTMSSISQTERGIINPTKQTLALICREFNVNKVWLETGEGPVEPPDMDPVAEVVSSVIAEGSENPFYRTIVAMIKQYQKLDDNSKRIIDTMVDGFISQIKNDPE